MRIDHVLVQRGLAATRSQAQRLIDAGVVQWAAAPSTDWQTATKPGLDIPAQTQLRLTDDTACRYVSRGGLKLQAALEATALDVRGWRCLDVGQSTGGFTDCLLQHGAAQVVGVDVGHGQLHPRLRADARVVALEGVNARHLNATFLIASSALSTMARTANDASRVDESHQRLTSGAPAACAAVDAAFDLVVMDVSFISQTLVLPRLPALLRPGGWLISLVKPQFELQPDQVGKGGVVRDASHYPLVQARVTECARSVGLQAQAWLASPIRGGDGNHEFLFVANYPVARV